MSATKLRRTAALLAMLLPATACTGTRREAPADHVFTGGGVYTVDAERRVVEAMATRGNRIVYVGDDEGARAFVGRSTRVHDLSGRMLLPGLHDVPVFRRREVLRPRTGRRLTWPGPKSRRE